MPAVILFSLAPVDTPRTTNTSSAVSTTSSAKDCQTSPAGAVAPRPRRASEQGGDGQAGGPRPGALAGDVIRDFAAREAAGDPEADGHRRVDMGAGDVADRIDHRHDDQAEGEGYAEVGDIAAGDAVHDDRARAGEDQGEGTDRFGGDAPPAAGKSPNPPRTEAAHGKGAYVLDVSIA